MTDIKATMAELSGALDLVLQERDELRQQLEAIRQAEPVAEVTDEKYGRVQFYRRTGDTSKPYNQPGTKLYVRPPHDELRLAYAELESQHGSDVKTIDDLRASLANVTRGKQAADLALTAQTANYDREKTDNALLRQLLEEAWRFDIGTRLKRDIKAALDSAPVASEPGDRDEVASLRAELNEWKRRCQYNADTAHDVARERDTLHAQLAERNAQLRSIANIPGDSINYHATYMSRIAREALCASAEPSAPDGEPCAQLPEKS